MRNGLLSIFFIAISLFVTNGANAKITLYSSADAVKKVLSATKTTELAQKYGGLSNVSINERNDSNAIQAFELRLTFSRKGTMGNRPVVRSCFVEVNIFVVKDTNAPAGITASKMTEPVFGSEVCEG